MLRSLLIVGIVMAVGCADNPPPQSKGVEIHAPGVKIKTGDNGVEVKAPGVEVKTKRDE